MRQIFVRSLGPTIQARTLDRLDAGVVTAHHRHNEVVYRQGNKADGIYFMGHGCVLLEWTAPNGFVAAFRLASSGECFGHRSFCGYEPRSTMARSIADSLTLHVPGAVLEEAMKHDPELMRALARLLARDTGPKISKIARNGRTPVRTRLAYLLIELTQRLQVNETGKGKCFEFPLTQKDLSNMLNVSQETVSRTIHEFERAGLVAIERAPRRLVVSDRTALADIAGTDE